MREIVVFLFFASAYASISKLVLYKNNGEPPRNINGDQCGSGVLFDDYEEFSCVCVSGLWALHKENCDQASHRSLLLLIAGTNDQCIHIDFQIRKANLLSPEVNLTTSYATVFDAHVASMGGKYYSVPGMSNKAHFVPAGFPVVITSGNQSWRLPHQKICIKPSLETRLQFCVFKIDILEEYRMDDADCLNEDVILEPLTYGYYMEDEDSEPCRSRVRRKVKHMAKLLSGRAFLETIQGFQNGTENEKNLTAADENYGISAAADMPLINSELWNFLTLRAQEKLGIRERRKVESSEALYDAAFTFLELAKEIQQKTCPDHYVSDDHYEIAVGAFVSILKNHYKYVDPFVDFATSERIEDSLRTCLANMTEYPFLERTSKPRPNVQCNDSKPVVHGTYFMFNETLELTIAHDSASRSNEPIVETAWKVFIHAHSACFPYFQNNLNDHHRFTTVMLQLFTSEINDLWFNVTELQPDIYTGFLGDAVDLMDSVAYCSIFSRLESNYPWDLPRPKKNNAGKDDGKKETKRRKREIEENKEDYQCLQQLDARNFCPTFEINLNWGDYDTDLIRKYL